MALRMVGFIVRRPAGTRPARDGACGKERNGFFDAEGGEPAALSERSELFVLPCIVTQGIATKEIPSAESSALRALSTLLMNVMRVCR